MQAHWWSFPSLIINIICSFYFHSFFVGELEKCLDDHEKLPELFIKHVCVAQHFVMIWLCFCSIWCLEVSLMSDVKRLYTGAKAAHVCCLLPEQTQVRIHCGRIWLVFWGELDFISVTNYLKEHGYSYCNILFFIFREFSRKWTLDWASVIFSSSLFSELQNINYC